MLVSVYYFLSQPKGYLGVHSPPYGGGAGGRGTSMSFITYVIMTSVHYVIMASASLLLYLLHTQPLMSLCHSGFCSSVTMSFTYSVPLCLYVILASVPLLPCLLHTLSPMSLCHSGSIIVKYFYKLPILSVTY